MTTFKHQGPGQGYIGWISDEQLAWLEQDLSYVPEDKLIVIAAHIPLQTDATDSPGVNTGNLQGLFDVLEGREHIYSIAGHDTSNSWQMHLGAEDGWTGEQPFHHHVLAEVRGGGWSTGPRDERGVPAADMADGNPNGYYRTTFDGTDYAPVYKPASLPADFQMRLSFHGGVADQLWLPTGPSGSGGFPVDPRYHARDWAQGRWDSPRVQVNVFDGGSRHQVEAAVDGEPFEPMVHSEPANDPYIEALRAELEGTPQSPVRPEPSSHLWSAKLPRGLAAGEHTLTVRSTDPYGRVSESEATFEVTRGRPAMN